MFFYALIGSGWLVLRLKNQFYIYSIKFGKKNKKKSETWKASRDHEKRRHHFFVSDAVAVKRQQEAQQAANENK